MIAATLVQRDVWMRQRTQDWWDRVVGNWGQEQWVRNFRMRRETFDMLGGRRCLVLTTVCLGLICVLLLVFITLYITITPERNLLKSYKNTVEEFNQTIIRLQDKNTDLMTEKDQLKNSFSSLSQKKLELETRVNDLNAEKSQLQRSFDTLSPKKLELETELRELSKQGNASFFISSELKSWSESRQYCRDHGADLVIINTKEKQSRSNDEGKDRKQRGSRCLVLKTVCLGLICVLLLVFITLYITITAERDLLKSYKNTVEEFNHTIISLQDKNTDLMTEKDQLKNNFNSLSQKNLELETRVSNLTAEKGQREVLQRSVDALNQKKLELETRITSLSEELKKEKSKQGNLCGPVCLFKSNESKSWSESRQFCRDRGADLIIINTEEKQKHLTSFIKERVWIGLSDIENEGIMKWVDNSTLNQGFWYGGEPNNAGDEDCVELIPLDSIQNWNDLPCSEKRKGVCEK
ncbi:unnamed protein product [Leuciscus chuanchicus]